MSISTIQAAAVLDEITNGLFASGINPTVEQIMAQVSKYFAQYPAGKSLPMQYDYIASDQITDVDKLNLLLLHIAINIDTAYQASLEQVSQLTLLTTTLASAVNRLTRRQRALSSKVDDSLLSAYNTSGYFYSISESFADTSSSDLSLTSAFVNTVAGQVTLPAISALSKVIDPSMLGTPSISASINGVSTNFTTISPLSFATNGLSNTVWEIQVQTQAPTEVVVVVNVPVLNPTVPIVLSEIDLQPYGVTPVQVYTQVGQADPTTGVTTLAPFGNTVQSGIDAMTFISQTVVSANSIQLSFRKTQPDYIKTSGGSSSYTYVFGASNITFVEKVYDNEATWISAPLSVAPDLTNDIVVDAVSLDVNAILPPQTNIDYYVALDPGNTTQISDFTWKPIAPIGTQSQTINTVVQFDGAFAYVDYIRDNPQNNDLQLIPLNSTNTDLSQRNPSPTIIPAVDVYTIANFTDTPLLNSITLEEGINSTRIYNIDYGNLTAYNNGVSNDDDNPSDNADLDAWAAAITAGATTLQYGHIDTGNGFFYGGDVGENGQSIYVETYLYLDSQIDPVQDSLTKADTAAQTWDVRAYLNGSQVGWLPGRNTNVDASPVDSLLIPWNFNEGLNHIALTITIPPLTAVTGVPNPYIGTVNLMQNHNLFDFGTVKLADWQYVDFFDLQYNTVGTPTTFTIYNNQIISRRQPTTNYRLTYQKPTNNQVTNLRVRAELSRDIDNMYISPQLNNFSLRFLYGNQS